MPRQRVPVPVASSPRCSLGRQGSARCAIIVCAGPLQPSVVAPFELKNFPRHPLVDAFSQCCLDHASCRFAPGVHVKPVTIKIRRFFFTCQMRFAPPSLPIMPRTARPRRGIATLPARPRHRPKCFFSKGMGTLFRLLTKYTSKTVATSGRRALPLSRQRCRRTAIGPASFGGVALSSARGMGAYLV